MPDSKTIKLVRALFGAGAGVVFGVLLAPRFKWRLHRLFGVDAGSIGPAIAIILVIATEAIRHPSG